MLKEFASWLARLAKPSSPPLPDPDGHRLADLLFDMQDPADRTGPSQNTGFSVPTRITPVGMTPPLSPSALAALERDRIVASTALFFEAAPASMKALRECGYIRPGPDGFERAVKNGREIPFLGYSSKVSFDEYHWGLGLRRVPLSELAQRERHILREQDNDLADAGSSPKAKKHTSHRM
jgi:hypothetical protein